MSSVAVRTLITDFITLEHPTENIIDLSGEFEEAKDLIESAGLDSDTPWLGLQFVGADEVPVDIAASNTQGQFREEGVIYLHVVEVAKIGPKNALLNRAEAIRKKFRAQRIGKLVIRSVTPPQTGNGVTINFQGGYTAALVQLTYEFQIDL